MQVESQSGGAATDTSGAGAGDSQNSQAGVQSSAQENQDGSTDNVVKPEVLKRFMDDLQKQKNLNRQLVEQVERERQEKETLQQQKLKEANDYKTLYERSEERAKAEAEKNRKLTEGLFTNERYNAVRAEAIRAGLRNEADLDLLDMSGVVVEATSQGRFLVQGADNFVQELKAKRPYWFKSEGVANINSGGNSAQTPNLEQLTPRQMFELEKKDPKKYREIYPKWVQARSQAQKK